MSLEELGTIRVTTASKEPETLRLTPAAVSVLTSEDIRRSGATSLPEILRLVPGVQVSRIDADHWAAGVRGFANQFSQSLVQTLDVLPHDTRSSVYSAFAQDEIAILANRLWLTIGSKLERNNYTHVEAQPSARILWMPTPTQSVWSGLSRAVRTPSLLEEGLQLTAFLAASPPTFVRVVGNQDFASERVLPTAVCERV